MMSEGHGDPAHTFDEAPLIDTARVAPRERFDFWRSSLLAAPLPLDVQATDVRRFAGRLESMHAGELYLSSVAGSDHHVFRRKAGIGRRSDGTFMIMVINAGSAAVTQAGSTAIAFSNDVVALDMDEPWDVQHQTACDILFVILPGEPFRGRSLHGGPMVLTARLSPLALLIANYIRGLPRDEDALSVIEDLAKDQLTTLLRRSLGERTVSPPAPPSLIEVVQNMIEAEIANPDLSAKLLCRRLGVSRTSLFDAMASERLTLGSTIRERRFAGVRVDVERAQATGVTLSEIAERWGYRDLATFSRAFKNRFGVAPTRWRAAS